ncbi:MAG: collagen-like protein [Bacteroidota bacterium]
MKRLNLLYVFSLVLSLTLVSCSGEDGAQGEIGPQGMTGPQGDAGNPGDPGADGADGQGFDELTQYGAITLSMEGTRTDDVPFSDEGSFQFTPIQGSGLQFTNFVSITEQGDDTIYNISIVRFLSAPDDEFQETALSMNFAAANIGEDNVSIAPGASLVISGYAVVGEDNKFFVMNGIFQEGGAGISEFEFSDLVFDAETNNLTFSYSLTIAGANNVTGNELNISGTADVNLLEPVAGL